MSLLSPLLINTLRANIDGFTAISSLKYQFQKVNRRVYFLTLRDAAAIFVSMLTGIFKSTQYASPTSMQPDTPQPDKQ